VSTFGWGDNGELLERAAPLSALRQGLDEACAGRGRLLLLAGEAGAGKTALLRRFADDVAGSARVLWGACDPLFTPRPLGPFLDIAGQVTGEFGGLVREGVQPHETLAALLRELDRGRPSLVVLEDVHWADEASLDLLGMIGRRIGQAAALVVASYRDDELGQAGALRTVLGELATAPAVSRLGLEPLTPAAVATMASPYGVDEQQLYRQTGGNPFYVTEVLGSGAASMPATVRDAVLARASRAGPGARQLLEAIAVVPAPVETRLLAALAGGDAGHLDECLVSGMLIHERGRVGFRHELARLAIEDSIPAGRAMMLHRAALRALRTSPGAGADPAGLAHHAEFANDAGAVLTFAPAAGDQAAAAGAHREAAAQYGRALRFAGSLPLRSRALLLERQSYECYLSDQPEHAIQARRQALAAYRSLGDRSGRRGVAVLAVPAAVLRQPERRG
jgi:predicted ATPase